MPNTNAHEIKWPKLKIKKAGISEGQQEQESYRSHYTHSLYIAVKGSCSLVPPAF